MTSVFMKSSTLSQIIDKDDNSIDVDDVTSKPSDKHFREAWTLSGTVISEDMAKAKEMFKKRIRFERKPLLEAEDAKYMKALEDNDTAAQTTIKNRKNSLRDAPAAAAITNATNITELKAAWDTALLGDSPYA